MTPLYAGIGGVVRELTEMYTGVGGVVKPLTEMWAGIDGVKRQIFSAGTKVGDLEIGDTVSLNVNGAPTDFIVVNQGIPSSIYDSSCGGTWLLMKDIYTNQQWNSSPYNDYEKSTINNYLNTTFLNLFESNIRDAIKQVKIPYRKGAGYGKTVTSGSSGLSTKIFLLSSTEVNLVHGYEPTNEGACLSYFSGTAQNGADNKRAAKLNGSATSWWLRSPYCYSRVGSASALVVGGNGDWGSSNCSSQYGIRPALVLPSNFLI